MVRDVRRRGDSSCPGEVAGFGDELDSDLATNGELEAVLVSEHELDVDNVSDRGGLEVDLDEEDEELATAQDADGSSACAPLPGAPDVVSRRTDTGSEGHPLCRFGRGAKEAGRRLPEKYRR